MIVDWLSFTLEIEPMEWSDLDGNMGVYRLPDEIRDQNVALQTAIAMMEPLAPCRSRAPYSMAWQSQSGLTIMYHPALPHVLIEFSGRGCKWLRDYMLEDAVIEHAAKRMTRIDIALDLPDLEPDDIVEKGYTGRLRGHSRIESDTGTTHYLGSVKSLRYVRVYRYKPPHPRSELCRIEAVHRKDYAKILAGQIVEQGFHMAAKNAMGSFEFGHKDVKFDGALPTRQIEKSSANTVRWLISQAAPAFKRLVSENAIQNPEQFLKDHFLQ